MTARPSNHRFPPEARFNSKALYLFLSFSSLWFFGSIAAAIYSSPLISHAVA